MNLMAVFQDIDKCTRCRGCQVACQRNWPRSQNSRGGLMLAASGTAEKIAVDDPTVVKAQRTDDRAPFVKYNCWHCPSPPCVAACKATGRGALTQQADGSVHIEQFKDPDNSWDKQFCDPTVAECKDASGRLVCVTACQRGAYPRRGKGDGVNDKIYKCTLCGKSANNTKDAKLPGNVSKWVATGGYTLDSSETNPANPRSLTKMTEDYVAAGSLQMPACVMTCTAGALYFGEKANIQAYMNQLRTDGSGLQLYPYKAGDGGFFWASRNIFGHPTGDPYVEDHTVPMLEMLLNSPAGKMLLVPTLVAGGLYALYERKKMRAKAEAKV